MPSFAKLLSSISSDDSSATFEAIPQKQKEAFNTILSMRSLSGLEEHIVANAAAWAGLLASGADTDAIPSGWENDGETSSPNAIFRRILLMKALRPDKVLSLVEEWVISVFGKNFPLQEELALAENIKAYGKSTAPLLLCSQPGHDASGKVDDLAKIFGVHSYKTVSMGSLEGFEMANSVISTGARDGSWVLLRNVHLCPGWLVSLEKKLHALLPKAHGDFRLFMTAEISPNIPTNIIKASEVFVFEPPSGVKAALHRSLAQISPQRMNKAPAERAKLHFLLAWVHSIIQERLRYVPCGWTKKYEFSDLDQKCSLDVADFWLDKSAAGRQNLSPEAIPWDAIQTLLRESIYGGRIGTEFDQLLLKSLLSKYLTPKAYESDFKLVDGETREDSIFLPSLTNDSKEEQLRAFLDALPDSNPPTWLGLPAAAHTVLLSNQATSLLHRWSQIQLDTDSSDLAKGGSGEGAMTAADEGKSRSNNLISSVRQWLSKLPAALPVTAAAKSQLNNPIFRFLQRESSTSSALLALVRENLSMVVSVLSLQGTTKATNEARNLIKSLLVGKIPLTWTQHYVSVDMGVNSWINDFARRLGKHRTSTDWRSLLTWTFADCCPFRTDIYLTRLRSYLHTDVLHGTSCCTDIMTGF
jgi:dynein heavy chain 1